MDLMEIITKKRYSTKHFDPEKSLSQEEISQLENLLRYSPSSTNIQPWHFIFAVSKEGKERICKGCQGFYSFNEHKVKEAGAVVVFASKVAVDEEYMHRLLEKEDEDGRYKDVKQKEETHGGRSVFANIHKFDRKDFHHWTEKQVYLNVGYFMLGVASIGLDSIAMEGFDFKALDQEFDLHAKGFTSCVVVAVGHHQDRDFNSKLTKSRLELSEIIEKI